MAYYPVQDITVVYGKTEDEIKANIAAKIADGYFPISDTAVWDAKLPDPTVAYRQPMVKYQDTDATFIANLFAAFKSSLDNINTKLNTANGYLSTIADNTGRIPEA